VEEIAATRKLNIDHFAGAFALAAIPARFALERGQWAEAAVLSPTPRISPGIASRRPSPSSGSRVGSAPRAAPIRRAPARNLARIEALRDAMIAAKNPYWAHQSEVQRLAVAGWIARAEGRNEEALSLMRASAAAEETSEKHPVTPARSSRPGAARRHADRARAAGGGAQGIRGLAPGGAQPLPGLYGAARAAELAGDSARARTYYGRLVTLGKDADADPTRDQAAKGFGATK